MERVTDPKKLRLFIAFDLPRPLLDAIAEAAAPLRERLPAARWTPIDNQHVTLKFLGWVPPDDLGRVVTACAGVAARHPAGSLSTSGFGVFPGPHRARVLWVGLEDEGGVLGPLVEDLEAAMEHLGFERENRSFTPHLTLARFKVPQRIEPDLLGQSPPPARFDLHELVLYRSHLSPKGPRYEAIETFSLRPTGGGHGP